MKTAIRYAGLALLLSPALPGLAQDFTPRAALEQLFEAEGKAPYSAPYDGSLHFSALDSKYDSGHGHGYRNELKIADKARLPLSRTREHFAARVTPVLPIGAKTIVAQYHVEGLDTILKVYVQDTADRQGLDGKEGNGVFDILVRILGTDGKEATTALGTVHSGEGFDLDIVFNAGEALVTARTASGGELKTPLTRIKGDDRQIYFKFGDYLQALDPDTGKHTIVAAKWDEYYRLNHIDSSLVSFSHTIFERTGVQP
jgi:hypothetical protein